MKVVILGGGYSAIWCYRAVRRWMGPTTRIVVVAPFTEQVFHGFTGEVLDGELAPELQTSPLDECVPHAERVRGWATAVDPAARTVEVEWEGVRTTIAYDQVVVATGAHDRTAHVPGLEEHGWPLRFPGRVGALLDHLAEVDTLVPDGTQDAARASTVVVVGAGFAGTEVAAALGRRYAGSRRIVLVSGSRTVVPIWEDRSWLQERLSRNLAEAGVELLAETRVVSVDADGVLLGDGSRIEAATVVASLGNAVPVIPGLEPYQEADGLLTVDDCLRVTDGVWSAGDAAAVRRRGSRAPKEALWAIRAGTRVGRNIARAAREAEPKRFRFRGLGSVAAFAPGRAVGTLWGLPVPEHAGWMIRAAFFLWYVPSRRTAWRILRWSLRRHRAVTTPATPSRPALVGLRGGVTTADRVRSVLTTQEERRVAGA